MCSDCLFYFCSTCADCFSLLLRVCSMYRQFKSFYHLHKVRLIIQLSIVYNMYYLYVKFSTCIQRRLQGRVQGTMPLSPPLEPPLITDILPQLAPSSDRCIINAVKMLAFSTLHCLTHWCRCFSKITPLLLTLNNLYRWMCVTCYL